MNSIMLLLIAGVASARHVPDQFNTRGVNGEVVIERRSENPERRPFVSSELRQIDKAVRTNTNQRFVQSTVKYNGQNHEHSLNNINYENVYRLRTNAYTTEEYSATERIVQEVIFYTNRKEQKYKEDRNPVNQDPITGQESQRGTNNVGYINCNEQKLRPENRAAVNNNQDRRRPETSIIIPNRNPQNEKKIYFTNHPEKGVSVLETVLIQPASSEKPREEIDILPITDSDDQIWLWGTEGTHVMTTEPGSLDDRAAFTGDKCPTGKARVQGICVDKH